MIPAGDRAARALAASLLLAALPLGAQPLAPAGDPFGMLPLVDDVDPTSATDTHEHVEGPAGASHVETILGSPARVLAPSLDGARTVAYRVGAGRGLVAGRAYLLVVDYPDDGPRTLAILNRGADQTRTVATGTALGDYREQYAYPNPESLRYPTSNRWRQYRVLFYLHDRFQALAGARGEDTLRRPDDPSTGFWVALGQFGARGNPRELGAAFGHIRLFEVPSPATYDLAVRHPPSGLPRRHTFWREEMGDGTAMCLAGNAPATCPRATADPVTWLDYKMRLARFLGIDTFAKDLLEFGYNQGWDSAPHGGDRWYASTALSSLWASALDRATHWGLDVLPYYEYTGALGYSTPGPVDCPSTDAAGNAFCAAALDARYRCETEYLPAGVTRRACSLPTYGRQHHCHPLSEHDQYTGFWWVEGSCADVTDPAALDDARALLDATVIRFRDRAHFLGAWFRTRFTELPMSFATETLARFAAEANGGAAVTRADLRGDPALLGRYYDWWFARRRAFLVALRDHLRGNGVADATILFTPYHQEGLVARFTMDRVATDDVAGWNTFTSTPGATQWRFPPVLWDDFVADGRFGRAITELTPAEGLEQAGYSWSGEELHSAPPADVDHYRSTNGVLLTAPFGPQFSVASAALLDRFRGPSGMAMIRHFPLNEDDGTGNATADQANGSYHSWPMSGRFGYYVTDVDRGGDHTMLAEARAVAQGDPTYLGYLASNSFNRGAPELMRAFNAAFLALPALPSTRLDGAASDPAVVVREIRTPANGTYYGVVNTAMTARMGVRVTLPADGTITDLVSGATRSRPLTLDLPTGALVALLVTSTPVTLDASVSDAGSDGGDAGDAPEVVDAPDAGSFSDVGDAGSPARASANSGGCGCRATRGRLRMPGGFALVALLGLRRRRRDVERSIPADPRTAR